MSKTYAGLFILDNKHVIVVTKTPKKLLQL